MIKKAYQQVKNIWKFFYNEKLKFIDEIEEKMSLKIQQHQAKYENSFKRQIRITQLKICIRYLIGGMLITSASLFFTDKIHDPNRPMDISIELLECANDLDERSYFAFDDLIRKGQELKTLDVSSYCAIGHLLASINQSEFSQTAFYFAHLKNHKEIKANSDLQFETVTKSKSGGAEGQ
ncbi:unnamed protein product [Paramecium sonneborni]|uniref:Uncharacterized protein n=1 Tax=Paramecium sonneborni TaxID=65129 RepID=A0A8S1R5X0_9CILI|nr:unnamed protein product [Paramecium sonneborni]